MDVSGGSALNVFCVDSDTDRVLELKLGFDTGMADILSAVNLPNSAEPT